MSKYKEAARDVVSNSQDTHITDNPNPTPDDTICQYCGTRMVDIQEYIGGLGYITFLACSDLKCRYGIRRQT